MAIVQVNVWSDGIGFVGCLVLGIVYTGYHIFLRFQRQAKVSHVTTLVSVVIFSTAFTFLPSFWIALEAGSLTSSKMWLVWTSLCLASVCQIALLLSLFFIASGMFVSNDSLSGSNRCRLIAISVLGGIMILPIVAITVLSFEQFVNAARTRDVNYTIVIYIFVAALIWIGVAIACSIVFCISFFRAIASTIEEIERLMGLSTDRKTVLLQTFRRFRIVALITIISRIVFSSATGLAAQGQTESATAQMAFGVLQMLVSVGFVLFISFIFRATQSESLDARVNAEWNHTGLNSFDQENEDF